MNCGHTLFNCFLFMSLNTNIKVLWTVRSLCYEGAREPEDHCAGQLHEAHRHPCHLYNNIKVLVNRKITVPGSFMGHIGTHAIYIIMLRSSWTGRSLCRAASWATPVPPPSPAPSRKPINSLRLNFKDLIILFFKTIYSVWVKNVIGENIVLQVLVLAK